MPIFTYTTKKLLKSPMNFIILILSIFALGLFYYLITYLSHDAIAKKVDQINRQNINVDWYSLYKGYFWNGWQLGILSLLISIFLFIFIALNSTKILRDEIDDGTLLILVSKPLGRSRIWVEKVLSLQVIITGFIFFSLIISSFLLPLPIFGGFWAFRTFFPFVFIAFGLILIIEIFVSAISFLISIFLRSIIVGSLIIGFGFFFIISNRIIDNFVSSSLSPGYLNIARASYTMKKIYNNVPKDTQQRLLEFDDNTYSEIIKIFNIMYTTYIFKDGSKIFPKFYSSQDEQKIVTSIVKNDSDWKDEYPLLVSHKNMITDIYYITETMRNNKDLSYYQMLISPLQQSYSNKEIHLHNTTGKVILNNNYSLSKVIFTLNSTKLLGSEYDNLKNNLSQLVILRWVNPFYQLSYVWDGFFNNDYQYSLTDSGSVSVDLFQPWNKDPYLVNLVKNFNGTYGIDFKNVEFQNSGNKILDWTMISIIYSALGIGLFGLSLYLFLRRDFT